MNAILYASSDIVDNRLPVKVSKIVDQYFKEKRIFHKEDPFVRWRMHEEIYSDLS